MDNNFPSDNRELNQNCPPAFQPVGVQINQQSYQPQQGYPLQQGYPIQQGLPPQQMYGQPIIVSPINTNALVVNQPTEKIVFGRAPLAACCPYCRANITTVVEDVCNGAAFSFCCICFCIYACYQSSRGKDLGCSDTKHRCPNCKRVIGSYIAM